MSTKKKGEIEELVNQTEFVLREAKARFDKPD
jgi:hypothetical protein